MPCVARPGASLARHGGTADVAWVSLLTVRAILVQVKLSFSRLPPCNTAISTTELTAGDLGCGKIKIRRSPPRGLAAATGWGNRTAAHVHTLWTNLWTTSCGLVIDVSNRSRLG